MNNLRLIFGLSLLLFIFSCGENTPSNQMGTNQIELKSIFAHTPIEQFNMNSKAIFRDSDNNAFEFTLSVNESIVEIVDDNNNSFKVNKVFLSYTPVSNFEIPSIEIVVQLQNIPELGFTELIICTTSLFSSDEKLTILPGETYKNTALSSEFSWMGETFENVYINILIEENTQDNTKLFYQPSIGIIGFSDKTNKSWVFDQYIE